VKRITRNWRGVFAGLSLVSGLLLGCGEHDSDSLEPLLYHDGYWVTEFEDPGSGEPAVAINDMHIDTLTRRVTVYAQIRVVSGEVVAPPQVGPGECTQDRDGKSVCFHPNAVYLNASGAELGVADGTGEWWVKHSWVLGGEGYNNCPLGAQENYLCFWVEGILLEDGLTMQIGGSGIFASLYNTRTPLLDEDPIGYEITRYGPGDGGPEAQFSLRWECVEAESAFDGRTRPCPR
jgi:hypothetical protein